MRQNKTAISRGQFKQRGFSLVELLVAMGISLFLLASIGMVYVTTKSSFSYANNTAHMSEDASFAIDSLSRDIRMASYGGCKGLSHTIGNDNVWGTADDVYAPKLDNVKTLVLTGDEKPNPFSTDIYTASTAIAGFPQGTGTAAAAARTALGTSTAYAIHADSPILYVAGGDPKAVQVSLASLTTSDRITIGTKDPYKWDNNFGSSTTPRKPIFLISDCGKSEIFRASSLDLNASIYELIPEKNSSPYFANDYTANAVISPLITSTYFLATPSGASTTSLYRRYFNGSVATIEELVKNVEALTFLYGENTSCINNDAACTASTTPSYKVDIYRTEPTDVLDWTRVISIRMGLILVSEDDRQTTEASTTTDTITWARGTYTVPAADRRLRRAYSTTVSIRNRMGL